MYVPHLRAQIHLLRHFVGVPFFAVHEEFTEAVAAAAKINFSTMEHLPLNVLETTARDPGGLLGHTT